MGGERFVSRSEDKDMPRTPATCDDCGRYTPSTLEIGFVWVCDACAEGMASEIRRLIREAQSRLAQEASS